MAIDPSTITWDNAPQQPAGVSASAPATGQIDPNGITWDQPAPAQPSGTTAPKQYKAEDFDLLINDAAARYKLDPRIVRSVVQQESSFNPLAHNAKSGAAGLMQLMPSTAADMGVRDRFDPAQNIEGGAKYLAQLRDRYKGNMRAALAAYNWGMGNLDRKGMNAAPEETRNYLTQVMGRVNEDVPMLDVPPDTQARIEPTPAPNTDPSFMQNVARGVMGFNKGFFKDIPDMGDQALGAILPDKLQRALSYKGETIQERLDAENKAYQEERARLGGEGMDWGRLAGNIVNPVTLATGATGEAAAVPAWFAKLTPKAQAMMGAMFRGGVAGAVQPVDMQQGQSFGNEKAKQIGFGAVAGPVAQGAANAVGRGAGALYGSIKNDMPTDVRALSDLAKQNGVDLTLANIRPESKTFNRIAGFLGNSPIPLTSLSPVSKAQQLQAQAAAQKLIDDQAAKLSAMSYQRLGDIQKIAAGGGERATEAAKILQMVAEAGPDEKAIMQASGNLTWLRKKISADKLYAAVNNLAGEHPVAPTASKKYIDEAVHDISGEVGPDSAFMKEILGWKDDLTNPRRYLPDEDPIEAAVRQAQGLPPPQGEPVINTFARMDSLRSKVQKVIADNTTDGVAGPIARTLKGFVKAIDRDTDNAAGEIPGLSDALGRARKFYDDHVVPYSAKTLAAALTNDTPEKIYGAFVRQQAQGRGDYAAKKFWVALDEKGRQAVRYGIVKDAMDQATSNGAFDVLKFRNTIRDTEYQTYFRGPELQRVEALNNLFNHLKNTTPNALEHHSAAFNGMLGVGVGAGMMAHPGAALTTLALTTSGGAFTKWLMTSDAGKRLLLANNPILKGGSQERIGQVLNQMARQFNAATGATAGALSGNQKDVQPQEGQ